VSTEPAQRLTLKRDSLRQFLLASRTAIIGPCSCHGWLAALIIDRGRGLSALKQMQIGMLSADQKG